MASVYKERGKFTVTWFDSLGKRHYARGLASRKLAEMIGERAEFQRQAGKHGLVDPKAEKYAREADRPLAEHVRDFRAALKARKNTPQYVAETIGLVGRVFDAAGVTRIDAIDRHRVHTTTEKLPPHRRVKDDRLSHRSQTKALTACKTFCAWLVDAGRLPYSPLAKLKGWDPEQDRRRRRTILTEAQAVALIDTTAGQPTRGGMTGIDRMVRYALGIGTGFRQRTLWSLTPESFHLEGDPPFIRAEASASKNRKPADQPIPEDLADLLRPWLAGKPRGERVFAKLPHADPVRAYRQDLAAAGIEYHDPDTVFYCDQHAHRGTYITAVIRHAGLKVAQDLAHHSTPALTSKYGQMGMDDYRKALGGLPRFGKGRGKEKKSGFA